jgi:hypothetical protein
MLFSEEEIRNEFPSLDFLLLETIETNLDEEPFHQSAANVARFLSTKSDENKS